MTTFKKAALFCLSLMATLAIAAGCNMGNDSVLDSSASSGEVSSVEESVESSDPNSESLENSSSEESSTEDNSSDGDSSNIMSGPDTPAPPEDSSDNNSLDSSDNNSSDSSDNNSSDSSDNNSSDSSDNNSSDSSDNNSSDSGDEPPADVDDPYENVVIPPIENTLTDDCTLGEWQLIKPAKCDAIGAMVCYCTEDDTHKNVVEIAAKGHDYGNNGVCVRCDAVPELPALPDSGYVNITKSSSGIKLSQSQTMENEMYNRYVLTTDTLYTAETVTYTYIDNETFQTITEYVCWIQFSIPEAGQYAVISKSNPNHLTITRYDANAHYVNPQKLTGGIMDDGNFIATVSVNDKYFNNQWITACCIQGTAPGQTVDFSIVRIDDAAWTPTTEYKQITAKDINGIKAPESAVGTKPAEVPYETEGIYFDEDKGYYCMPGGSPIFAAITKKAPRQFGGGTVAFSDLLDTGSESNFVIHVYTLPNGNPVVNVYTTMLLADPYKNGYNENSYEAQVNSDGLYPVTKELYEFLKLHAAHSRPANGPSAEYADNAWLAACYYYKEMEVGSQEYPMEFTEAGTYTIQQSDEDAYYYFTVNLNAGALSTYKISINTYKVRLYAGTNYYSNSTSALNIQNLYFESSNANNIIFYCYDTTFAQNEIEIVIEEVNGSFNNPIAIEANGQNVTMQPMEIITVEGTKKYEVYYAYTVTQSGTLTLNSDSTATIILGGSEMIDGTATLNVVYDAETPENNVIMICVTSTDTTAVNVNLTFTAA